MTATQLRLTCLRCSKAFDADKPVGYCPACVEHFKGIRQRIHAAQHIPLGPRSAALADLAAGVFKVEDCPKSIPNPDYKGPDEDAREPYVEGDLSRLCGCCGTPGIITTYGLGSGFGIGVWSLCMEPGCMMVQDVTLDGDDDDLPPPE